MGLCLKLRPLRQEVLHIGPDIKIVALKTKQGHVAIYIEAPKELDIWRTKEEKDDLQNKD